MPAMAVNLAGIGTAAVMHARIDLDHHHFSVNGRILGNMESGLRPDETGLPRPPVPAPPTVKIGVC
ncbi:hypothetical protein PQ455_02510 [Sphingomonas naphthae]|uniref:Uncharacterized protein n=1 Tax=Sphingomonas naphthae TaxID=1813468 RepID=A0ABY7TQK3_9SPHN|nr:hypothetical protein [Sphingomonas naphthae]WCT74124.1 hypothetical protein PQ455_02510 [Sphingomonas naphthae]